MRKFLCVIVIGLFILELDNLLHQEPFNSSIKLTYAIIQCEKELSKNDEVIRCNDNAQYRKTQNNLIRID